MGDPGCSFWMNNGENFPGFKLRCKVKITVQSSTEIENVVDRSKSMPDQKAHCIQSMIRLRLLASDPKKFQKSC
jgi:hypothetical protein